MSPTELKDYHRIVSSMLRVPSDPSVAVPVGLLACQRGSSHGLWAPFSPLPLGNPLLKELETYVITCTVSSGIEAPKDRKKKPQAIQQEEALIEVLLQDTVLFPEGGGQPSDIGLIKDQDGQCWDVLEIKRRGGHAIHYIKSKQAQATLDSLVIGARVTVALGEEGFKRRYDHVRLWIFFPIVLNSHCVHYCTTYHFRCVYILANT